MTRVYRILRKRYAKTPFDGEGSFRFGGRWSSPGTRLVYTSERLSLAMIEYHIHIGSDDSPPDLVVASADVPNSVSRTKIATSRLGLDWRESPAPPHLAAIGDSFVAKGTTAILIVPSVLCLLESNWLINPRHPDFRRVRVNKSASFYYDRRFFE